VHGEVVKIEADVVEEVLVSELLQEELELVPVDAEVE